MSVNIVAENALNGTYTYEDVQAGSPAWDGNVQDTIGFTHKISYNVGETVQFRVNGPGTRILILRTGYYADGKPFRQVAQITNTPTTQPELSTIPNSNGGTSAGTWTTTATWQIPSNAVSGIYQVLYYNGANNDATHGSFVVRDDDAVVDIIYKTSDTTWGAAYNDFGTKANRRGKNVYGQGTGVGNIMDRCFAVSYHRPNLVTYGVPLTNWWSNELPMIRFMERNGFSVKYVTGVDLDREGVNLLRKGKVFISSGHDEYWSLGMRRAVESYRDNYGGHSLFMSGNEVFWKTRFETNPTTGEVIMWCHKDTMPGPSGYSRSAGQPLDPVAWTGTWKDTRWAQNEPEWFLTGTDFRMNAINNGLENTPIVSNPYGGHKVWGASVLVEQDIMLNRIIGFEADEARPTQPSGSYKLLAAYTRNIDNNRADDNGQNYTTNGNLNWGVVSQRYESGAVTVGFGTCQWSWLLDNVHQRGSRTESHPAGQQMVVNLLRDLGAEPATVMSGITLQSTNDLDVYGVVPTGTPPVDPEPEPVDGSVVFYDRNGTQMTLQTGNGTSLQLDA